MWIVSEIDIWKQVDDDDNDVAIMLDSRIQSTNTTAIEIGNCNNNEIQTSRW